MDIANKFFSCLDMPLLNLGVRISEVRISEVLLYLSYLGTSKASVFVENKCDLQNRLFEMEHA